MANLQVACKLCRLGEREDLIHPCIGGRGDIPADILFVGEAPGRDEDFLGIPFIGRAGDKLEECIDKAGLKKYRIRISNICRCQPEGNRRPKPDEIAACLPYLLEEIEMVQPRAIVVMGNAALKLLGAGLRTVMKERGEVYPWNGIHVLVTFHPAMLLRKWEDEEVFISDLKLVHKILEGKLARKEVDYRVILDLPSLRALRDRLCSAEEFTFDLETTSFDWQTEEILCMAFSDKPFTGFCVPLLGQHRSQIWTEEELPEVRHLLREIFESPARKIGQNFKFDVKFLRFKLGINPTNLAFDTIIAHHSINENLPGNLEFLTSYYLHLPRHDKEVRSIITSKKMTFDMIPNEILWKYNCADADTTLQLAHIFEPQTPMYLMNRIRLPLSRALMEMEMAGVYVDLPKLEENSRRYRRLIDEEAEKIYEQVGYEFKIGSTKVLAQILFSPEGLGLPPAGFTDKGNHTTNKDALEMLENRLKSEGNTPPEKLAVLSSIVRYRNLKHWKTTFIDGPDGNAGLKRWVHPDSRIYPNYRQTGTDMGRLAISEPNLQNIPRDQELRNQFAAPPGWLFLHADASQAEARAGAIIAQCKSLLDSMKKGLNIHRNAAAKLRKIAYEAVTQEQYEMIKFVTHGLHYGRSIPSIAAEYGLPIREVQQFVENYFNENPELADLMLEQVRKVVAGEPITNRFGRTRHFPEKIGGHEKRQAISFPFASNWADAQSLLTSRCYERFAREGVWLTEVKMVMSQHDALFFEVKEDKIEKIASMIIEEVESPVEELDNYSFPFKIDVGRCWEDAKRRLIWEGK